MRSTARILAAFTLFVACGERPVEVSLSQVDPARRGASERGLKVAVSAMESPEMGFSRYADLFNRVGSLLGEPIEVLQRDTYSEVLSLVEHRRVDAALVCSGPYVQARADFGARIIAVPRIEGKTAYEALILVHSSSSFRSLEDLRGRSFALTDPLSTSGMVFPAFLLRQKGERTETFFSKVLFTKSHDNSVNAVADGLVDGASVSALVLADMVRRKPSISSRLRVIARSPPFGNPPLIAHPESDAGTRDRLEKVLLTLHDDHEGARLLRAVGIDRFERGDPSRYAEAARMRALVLARPGG